MTTIRLKREHADAKYKFEDSTLHLYILDKYFNFEEKGSKPIDTGISFTVPDGYIGMQKNPSVLC